MLKSQNSESQIGPNCCYWASPEPRKRETLATARPVGVPPQAARARAVEVVEIWGRRGGDLGLAFLDKTGYSLNVNA
jgi:hypothetical protein